MVWIGSRGRQSYPKRYRTEEIVVKLPEAEVLLGRGAKVHEITKAIGISEAGVRAR